MDLLLAPRAGNPPPPWFIVGLFLVVFFGGSLLSSRLMGVFQLYRSFPADKSDPIEANLGWIQIEFGVWRGHTPMSVKAGQRCLHIKQPFPFQPLVWLGPASIPWDQIRIEKEASPSVWAFMSVAEFRLGPEGRLIRLRGKAARRLQTLVTLRQEGGAPRPGGPPEVGPIRPR